MMRRLALLAVVLCGCSSVDEDLLLPPTQVMAIFDADSGIRAASTEVHVLVLGGEGDSGTWEMQFDDTLAIGEDGDWPLEISLTPKDDDASRLFEIVATAIDSDGDAIAQVRAIGGYKKNELFALHLRFHDECLAITEFCPEGQTCDTGECVNALVEVDDLTPYEEPSSTGDGDAVSGDGDGDGDLTGDGDGDLTGDGDGDAMVDPCATGCDPVVRCTPVGDVAVCGVCPDGYVDVNEDGTLCEDIDECAMGLDGCDDNPGACQNTDGGFECVCPSPYTGPGVGADGCYIGVISISTSGTRSCATRSDGTVRCWGSNTAGVTPELSSATHVETGGSNYNCALLSDQSLSCWGSYANVYNLIPADLGPVRDFSNYSHQCAVLEDGSVRCWNDPAAIDYGHTTIPTDLGLADSIDTHGGSTCVLLRDGAIRCFGSNTNGNLSVPADLPPATQMSTASGSTCALLSDASIRCWGDFAPAIPVDLGVATEVCAGGRHTCAIVDDGNLVCWGLNNSGESDVPGGLGPVASIACASVITCVLLRDGTARCWGNDNYGQATVPGDLNAP